MDAVDVLRCGAWLVPLALLGCAGAPACPPARAPDETPDAVVPRRLLSGPLKAAYTREAIECRIEGVVVAQCWLTTEGDLIACTIERSLPWLSEPVLYALSRRTYERGRPQFVRVTFRFSYPETIE